MYTLGLEDVVADDQDVDQNDPIRFTFVDGNTDFLDFFDEAAEFPWSGGQPDGGRGDDLAARQKCGL